MNITVDKNKHDIQSNIMLIGKLNDIILIKGISIEIKIFFIKSCMAVIKGSKEYSRIMEKYLVIKEFIVPQTIVLLN